MKTSRALITLLMVATLTLTLSGAVHASILFNNMDQTRAGTLTVPAATGQLFITDNQGYTLDSIVLMLGRTDVNGSGTYLGVLDLVNLTDFSTLGGLLSQSPVTTTVAQAIFTPISPIYLLPQQIYAVSFSGAFDVTIGKSETLRVDYTNSVTGTGAGFITGNLIDANYSDTAPFMMQVNATAQTAVPEPSTYALLCISLGVVGFARKRMVKSEE